MSGKIPGYNQIRVPTMDPQSAAARERYLDISRPGVEAGLQRRSAIAAGDPSQFDAIEKPAFENFNRLLGNISSRYAGVGSGQMSARNSSAFQNETTGAAGDLAATLQEKRLGLQDEALNGLLGLSKDLFSRQPYENEYMPKKRKKKWYETLTGAIAPVAGAAAGGYFGGPAGAALGGSIGASFGSAFGD
jgi:hypothetical protein